MIPSKFMILSSLLSQWDNINTFSIYCNWEMSSLDMFRVERDSMVFALPSAILPAIYSPQVYMNSVKGRLICNASRLFMSSFS